MKHRLTRCFSEKQNIGNMVAIKIEVDSRNVENKKAFGSQHLTSCLTEQDSKQSYETVV